MSERRRAFEAWLASLELDPHRHPDDGDYTAECTTERAWLAWQAATERAAKVCGDHAESHKRQSARDSRDGHLANAAREDYQANALLNARDTIRAGAGAE